MNRSPPIFLSPVIALIRVARSSKFSIKISHGTVGLWVYADLRGHRGANGVLGQRSRHCTVKRTCCAALHQKWKAIQLWHSLALVLGCLLEPSSDWCGHQVTNILRVGRSTSHDNRAIKMKDASEENCSSYWSRTILYMAAHKRPPIYIDCTSWRFFEFHALTIGCFTLLLFMQHETDSRARPICVIHPTF